MVGFDCTMRFTGRIDMEFRASQYARYGAPAGRQRLQPAPREARGAEWNSDCHSNICTHIGLWLSNKRPWERPDTLPNTVLNSMHVPSWGHAPIHQPYIKSPSCNRM